MTLPAFTPSVDRTVEGIILGKLGEIERDHGVCILFAVESGSWAWGFPSPYCDYDVRFVYAHAPDWYLSLKPGRDVIELPMEGDWDINGWEIRKALNLLLTPNPVLLEWLSSPIRSRWDDQVCVAFGEARARHCRNFAHGQWDRYVRGRAEVNEKTYSHSLRPAIAIHLVRTRPGTTPPMALEGLPMPPGPVAEIDGLLRLKAKATETGVGAKCGAIEAYFLEQIDWAASADEADPRLMPDAEARFRASVEGERA
ncbi:MAG: nucleotidyltransferase domain-containing protein [Pseudomonadota bacterium]